MNYGSVAGFNTAECNAEPPPGVRALLIALNPAPAPTFIFRPPTSFNPSLLHAYTPHCAQRFCSSPNACFLHLVATQFALSSSTDTAVTADVRCAIMIPYGGVR
ncbi:unnamed protein product [Rodentolepis nana]|uniref:Uncharacterized protein n=1 Tax=Rodentolepis nana TaxID=102285 RepID=A0A0R3TMF7_RODNA|nr:unnamed protein product [Rodentolepis nana]